MTDRTPFSALHFRGRMNAHISHDLKNVTATISETAWLLQDLLDMMSAKKEMDGERLKVLISRIIDETDRGNGLLKNLNTFAHSTDKKVKRVDLRETAELMAGLASCLPFARMVEVDAGTEPVEVATRPYFIEQYCYHIFRANFEAMKPERKMTIKVEASSNARGIALGPLATQPDEQLTAILDEIAAEIGGKSEIDAESKTAVLSIEPLG